MVILPRGRIVQRALVATSFCATEPRFRRGSVAEPDLRSMHLLVSFHRPSVSRLSADGTSVIEEMADYPASKPSRPSDHKVVAIVSHDEPPSTISWASRTKSRFPDPQVATKVKRAIFQPSTPVTRSAS